MENEQKPVQAVSLYWDILTTRIRKDLFKKPKTLGGGVKSQWLPGPTETEVCIVIELSGFDTTDSREIELFFVSVKGTYSIKGAPRSPNSGFPILPKDQIVTMGLATYYVARGVLLAKSTATFVREIVMREPDPQMFLETASKPDLGFSIN